MGCFFFFIFIFSLLAIIVTDTAFRKSSLGKLVLEKIVRSTSKNWQYYRDLLVFCLKFKLSPVCKYLNYYYNTANDRVIPEKSEPGGLRTLKYPGSFRFFTLSLQILDKKKLLLPLEIL